MTNDGRGRGRRRRSSRGREDYRKKNERQKQEKKTVERLKWTAPKLSREPLPVFECPYCNRQVKELGAAITDKFTGIPAHFDCVMAKLAENEHLGSGDSVAYIGGGRFGIVHHSNVRDKKIVSIKKIIDWEDQNNRAEWRKSVADRFSAT